MEQVCERTFASKIILFIFRYFSGVHFYLDSTAFLSKQETELNSPTWPHGKRVVR